MLGVCLGAQQLAAALGAAVTTGPSPEIGVDEVELTAEGRADPVLGPEGDRVSVIQWHGDTFEIPDGAVRLATGDALPQPGVPLRACRLRAAVPHRGRRGHGRGLGAGAPARRHPRRRRPQAVEAVGRRVLGRFVELALSARA